MIPAGIYHSLFLYRHHTTLTCYIPHFIPHATAVLLCPSNRKVSCSPVLSVCLPTPGNTTASSQLLWSQFSHQTTGQAIKPELLPIYFLLLAGLCPNPAYGICSQQLALSNQLCATCSFNPATIFPGLRNLVHPQPSQGRKDSWRHHTGLKTNHHSS